MLLNLPITLTARIARTIRVQQLEGLFDLPPSARSEQHWHHKLALPESWNIGVIVGPSGCGKTTLAREAFARELAASSTLASQWPLDKSVLDGFPANMGIRDITALLCSVGFSSPPAWLRPFNALSNGEQFRVTVARTLAAMPAASAAQPPALRRCEELASGAVERPDPSIAVIDEFTSVVDRTAARIGSHAVAKAVRQRNQKFIAITCHYDILVYLVSQ